MLLKVMSKQRINMNTTTIAILGAGSWGTAVAIHLAESGHRVLLWGRDPIQIRDMARRRENTRYLPNVVFPKSLIPTEHITTCFNEAQHLIIATPSHAFASTLNTIPLSITGLSWITKGIDPQHNTLLSQLVFERYGHDFPIAIIAGPSFANEVAKHMPTALVIAGNNSNYSSTIRGFFEQKTVRAYLTQDIVGVQLCGATKNVLAIACGISDGLQYGANAKAALITRGLAEMSRLGIAFEAHANTFMGLSGVGDLVLTCTDNQSRNRRFGLLLGQGVSIQEAEKQIGQVVEGKYNAAQVCALAKEKHIELPICSQVNAVIQGHHTAQEAAQALMVRPLREKE
jgi:glycerol-3-phosphate dehydrogenase (NAD(P)+)